MFFTCCLCFAMIWNTMSPSLNCSITKSLIPCDERVANANLSPIFKSPWTCRPFWLTWFCWMKHNFDACLNRYNVLMVNLVLRPLFIEPPHFFLKSCVPLWQVLDRITIPLMSIFLGVALLFCVMSLTTFVRSLGPYWHCYLRIVMSTNLMLPMNINYITKQIISRIFHV